MLDPDEDLKIFVFQIRILYLIHKTNLVKQNV